jgi:hypothetical protein
MMEINIKFGFRIVEQIAQPNKINTPARSLRSKQIFHQREARWQCAIKIKPNQLKFF